jgi:hypothetical protein
MRQLGQVQKGIFSDLSRVLELMAMIITSTLAA